MMQHEGTTFDAIILGAGASGLMCAAVAGGRGKRVLLIDHAAKPARKLSITGGGKCNLTNRTVQPQDYVGDNPHFCRSALSRFTPDHMLHLLHNAGIEVEERKQGQIFCRRSAKDLINLLLRMCMDAGCRLALDERIIQVERAPLRDHPPTARFRVHTQSGVYEGHALVLALGGPAWPQVGASGRGYELARAFGHRIVPFRPALAGLVMPADWPLAGLSGISLPASIRVLSPVDEAETALTPDKQKRRLTDGILAADNLSLLFTHKGVSGPAALQASLYWRKRAGLRIDFLPGLSLTEALHEASAGKLLCRSLLRRHLPDRLCDALAPAELADKKIAELSRRDREYLNALFKKHEVTPVNSEGFAKAEVAAGGVSTEDVSSRSMESAKIPGLFFCGEILDVTGRLGGYNLHWAFASGNAAGAHV